MSACSELRRLWVLVEGSGRLPKRSLRGLADDGGEGSPLGLYGLVSWTLVEGAFICEAGVLDVDWRSGLEVKVEL